MQRAARLFPCALIATLVACAPTGTPLAVHKTTPAAGNGAGIMVNGGAGIMVNGGAGIVSGTVRAPAALLQKSGANIMVNGGAGIMVNGGAGLVAQGGGNQKPPRTVSALPEELPVQGATVTLLDAAGNPVLVDGKPVTATTDAKGHYKLAGLAGKGNYLVAVDLGAGNRLAAVASAQATGDVDAGLVSTLVADYILNRFVKGQADPQATFDRLPPALEAQTRGATSDALAHVDADKALGGLAESQVVGAVDTLRQQVPALGTQLDHVQAVMLGLSDLGNGHAATGVSLSRVGAIAVGPTGTLYIDCAWTGRIWRLADDGSLATVAGRGSGSPDDTVDGKLAADAAFGFIDAIAVDAGGRTLILEDNRLSRVGSDGKLAELVATARWPKAAGRGLGVLPLDGDQVRVVTEGGIYLAAGDGQLQLQRAFTPAEASRALGTLAAGQTPAGGVWLARYESVPAIYSFDATGQAAPDRAWSGGDGLVRGVALDVHGNVFTKDAAGKLAVTTPDGQTRTLTTGFPVDQELGPATPVALAADGTAYFTSRDNHVYRIADGALTLVAGAAAAGPTAATRPSDVAIDAPSGVVELEGGDLVVSETHAHRLLRIAPNGTARVIAGTGEGGLATDGPAAASRLWNPSVLRLDAKGNLYVLDNTYPNANTGNFIREIAPDGTLHTLRAFKLDEESVRDFVTAPDGGLYVSMRVRSADESRVVYYPADGSTPVTVSTIPLQHSQPSSSRETLALGADGALSITGQGRLARWSAGSGLSVVETDPVYQLSSRFNGLCVDAKGRCYMTNQNTIVRRDPSTGKTEVVAGKGSSHYAGDTVDDGLLEPANPMITHAGDLLFLDREHRQIKEIPAAAL